MGLTPLSHPCDPAVAHPPSRIIGGLVRYRENATLPLNPDYNYINYSKFDGTYQPDSTEKRERLRPLPRSNHSTPE